MDSEVQHSRWTLRDILKQRLSDNQRFLLVCILCGLLCGLAAVCLHWTIHHIFDSLWHWASEQSLASFISIMLGAPTLAGLVVGVAGAKFAPTAVGSGIPQTKLAYYNNGGRIHTSSGIWRFLLTSLYCGLGNSLGREGPTVHLSAAISAKLGKLTFKKPERRQDIIPVGMAAGIAAAFNAPLSAITFVFEELLDNFSMKSLGGIVIAVVTAAAVSRTLNGEDPILNSNLDLSYQTATWMLVALPMGLVCGILGHLFIQSVIKLRGFFTSRSDTVRMFNPAVGGFGCGVLGIGAFFITDMMGDPHNSVFSIGYESLEQAFEASVSFQIIAVLLILKLIAVILNYASGGSGGLFSPTLFIGGMLGSLFGFAAAWTNANIFPLADYPGDAKVIGGCVLLGMGSMFSSVIRCPFTSLIIIFEMTGNYSLILPLMACNIISWQLSKKFNPLALYDSLLLQDGISLKKFPSYHGVQDYRKLPISTIMTYDVSTLKGEEPISHSLAYIKKHHLHFHGYPVLDNEDNLLGIATHHEFEDADERLELNILVADQDTITATPDTSIHSAANLMITKDIQQLPVVSPNNPQKLIGLVTLNDIARQQNMI